MRKKFICVLICALTATVLFPVTVSADIGPKPSVVITFDGLGDEICYGTLLSSTDSTGPSSVWDGREETAQYRENEGYEWAELDYDTWKAFADYEDADGYYFLQEGWRVDETKELAWTYYPPQTFKILLYFPEKDAFVISGSCERYAFDSYFTVDMEGISMAEVRQAQEGQGTVPVLTAEESYDYTWELISLAARIAATILLELGAAVLFGFRSKRELLLIGAVNIVTQVGLNVLLNVVNYRSGYAAFTAGYALLEVLIFVIETALYCRLLPKLNEKPQGRRRIVLYTLAANLISFGAGFAIAKVLPGIF